MKETIILLQLFSITFMLFMVVHSLINRNYELTDGEMFGLNFPVIMLLFFETVGVVVLSENLKD